jgi:putative addiction module killer protein
MIAIRETAEYRNWISRLRDNVAKARIAIRIRRLILGNAGDVKPVGEGVSELRIDYGPGYRVYFIREGALIVVLLCGGDKSSQERDIAAAKRLAKSWKEQK